METMYYFHSSLNDFIAINSDLKKLYREICRIAVKRGGFLAAWTALPEKDSLSLVCCEGLPVKKHFVIPGEISSGIMNNKIYIAPKLPGALPHPEGTKSIAVIPFLTSTGKSGAAAFYSPQKDFFEHAGSMLINDVANHITFAISVITDKHRAAEAEKEKLRNSEMRFRTIFEKNPIGTYLQDLETLKFVDVNEQLVRTFGFSRDEIIGHTTDDLKVWVDPSEKAMLTKVLRTRGYISSYESVIKNKSGDLVNTLMAVEIIELDGKKYTLGMLIDLTENRKNTDKLKLQSKLLDSIGQAVEVADPSGIIIYMNRAAEILYGYTRDEVIGRPARDFINLAHLTYERIIKNASLGKPWFGDVMVHKKDKNEVPVFATANPIFNEGGKFTGIITIQTDLTEIRKREKELSIAKEKAEEMNKLKSSLLANMSHELRTPLAGIIGFAELLSSVVTVPEHQEMTKAIKESSTRLLETLNLILELSRIEASEFSPEFSDFNLAQALAEEIRIYKGAAFVKNLELNVEYEDMNISVNTDRRLFSNIISNLLSNAVKFTKQGSVEVKLYREKKHAVIEVADTGIGIPEDGLEKIFEPFRQLSQGHNRNFEGTGLGLTLVKKSVQVLGGKISVKSKKDKGSVFTIKLKTQ